MHPTVIIGGIPWAHLSATVTVGWTRCHWLSHLRDVCHAPDPTVASLLLGKAESLGERLICLWLSWQIQHRWFLMQTLHLPVHEEHQSQVPSATPEFHISVLIISINCNKPVHGFYLSQEVFFLIPQKYFKWKAHECLGKTGWLPSKRFHKMNHLGGFITAHILVLQPIDLDFRNWILST